MAQIFIALIFSIILYPDFAIADAGGKDCDRLAKDQGINCSNWGQSTCKSAYTANCNDENHKDFFSVCSPQGLEFFNVKVDAKAKADAICGQLKLTDPVLHKKECLVIQTNYDNIQHGITTQVGTAQDWFSQWTQKCSEFGDIAVRMVDAKGVVESNSFAASVVCPILDQLANEGGSKVTDLNSFKDSLVKYCPNRVQVDTVIK